MTQGDTGGTKTRTLATLARALGVPLETFFDPIAHDPERSHEAEEAELLSLFREIRDPRRRAHCLTLVRDMAGPPGDGTDAPERGRPAPR